MNIHQLSVIYQVEQDRILVQANTLAGEVLRVWLTRRLTVNLFPRLVEQATQVELSSRQLSAPDAAARKMLMDFKKQEVLSEGDFQTPFNPTATTFPVGPLPLLATTVTFTPAGSGALRIEFDEKLPEHATTRGFQITLASTLLHGFMHLFEAATKASGWELLGNIENSVADDPFSLKNDKQAPPSYLN